MSAIKLFLAIDLKDMNRIIGIIPARYASTRFPGKPLVDIGGKSMIQRVYEQATKCKVLSEVIVATDDQRIADHVKTFKGKVVITSADHQSGTDRCAEALSKTKADIVINIQGDEPFIDPQQISLVASCFDHEETYIASLYKKLSSEEDIRNPNIVKVILNNKSQALYFSRAAIPYRRNPGAEINYHKHIGIYGYRADVLREITKLEPSGLEMAESLEQLRWLENGYSLTLRETVLETIAIDTPADLQLVEKILKS